MWAGRFTVVLVLAGFLLAFATAGIRHVKHHTAHDSTRIPRDCAKPTYAPSGETGSSRYSKRRILELWLNRISVPSPARVL
jgi:hypothetical protein